jgi:manganese efflux pump family protein
MTKADAPEPLIVRRRNDARAFVLTLIAAAVIVAGGTLVLHAAPGVTTPIELKILGIALAVGLDVLALSIAVGIMQVPWNLRIRLGLAFSGSEVLMQVVGYAIGTGAGRLIGTIADYVGFAVLAGVGVFIVRESFGSEESTFKVHSGWGLVAACASISLDSLGIGVSLPGVPLPLLPLLATVAVSTTIFTTVGLAFGTQLGQRYQHLAERVAGVVLLVLAAFFTVQHLWGWGT